MSLPLSPGLGLLLGSGDGAGGPALGVNLTPVMLQGMEMGETNHQPGPAPDGPQKERGFLCQRTPSPAQETGPISTSGCRALTPQVRRDQGDHLLEVILESRSHSAILASLLILVGGSPLPRSVCVGSCCPGQCGGSRCPRSVWGDPLSQLRHSCVFLSPFFFWNNRW